MSRYLCTFYLAPGVVVPIGVGVGGVGGVGVDGLAPVAKHGGKDHHENQDGVGDHKDQHKRKTDDAELFGLRQFVLLLLTEGLREEKEWCGCERMCECAFTTHQYTHDCGWHKAEKSWQPTEDCEDQCSRHTSQEGVLGEVGGVSCECLLCDWSRLGGNHLPLRCAYVDGEEDGVCETRSHQYSLPSFPLTG